jgi:hypothetical protein
MAEVRRRRSEYWAGLGTVLVALAVASFGLWPVPDGTDDRSWPSFLLGDPALVGIVRLAIVVAALYFIASVPALIVGGRWAKGLGATGLLADDARTDVDLAIADAERQVAALRHENLLLMTERNEFFALLDDVTAPE